MFKVISPHNTNFAPDLDGIHYIEFFHELNVHMRPKRYFEIGTETGLSVEQFTCNSVCVDPYFKFSKPISIKGDSLFLFQITSDDFFRKYNLRDLLGLEPDVCFLDGMHRFEYLLRDFINTEKMCKKNSSILIHDCLPSNNRMALRTNELGDESEGELRYAWTGDVWKIIPILHNYRPDVTVNFIDCPPTGLVLITGLDSKSTILSEKYFEILNDYISLTLDDFGIEKIWKKYKMLDSQKLIQNPDLISLFFPIF